MGGCNSSSKQIQKEWKKANTVLKLKFKEYTDLNQIIVDRIVDMRHDAVINKSALLQLLQDYLSNLQECCASLGSKIDETIYLFENIGCLCPPTTTTTEQPVFTTTATEEPTPTTTSEPTPEECNQPTEVDEKGSFYPYIVTKFLGTDTGLVTLTFTTYDIPDRFVVEWDTNDVIDTGYHGLAKYQTKLNAAVAVYGDVAGPINTAQTGAVSFIKDNANPWAIVKVYAPLKNTRFEFTLSCPEPFETTTTTTENCWNWILTDIANDGNWTYFDVEYCDGSSEIIALRNGQIRVVCLSNAISFNPLRGTAVNTNLSCNTTTTSTEELVTTTTEEGTTTTTFPCDLEVEVLDPIPVTTTTTTAEPVTTTTEEPVTTTTEEFVTTTTAEPCLFPPDYDVPATLFMTVVSPPLGIFSGSFVNACNALYGFNNLGYTIAPGYYAVSKRHGFNDYWRIGDLVFDTEECSLVPSGYYIVQVPGQDYRVIYIVDGEIISYPECPVETTTTTTCEECDTEKYSLIISVMNNTIDVDLRVLDVEGSVDAWCTWVSEELVNQYGYGLQGTVCGTIEVGQILYIGDKCTLLPTGSYIYDPNFVVDTETLHTHFNVNVLEIVDGEIMSITPTDCEPETTTTTTADLFGGRFAITVDTTKAGSANDTFVLPGYPSGTYDYYVDWGDGGAEEHIVTAGNQTHEYASSGTYQIKIRGTFPRIYFNGGGDKLKLTSIDNWGDIEWSSMERAFRGCANMIGVYSDAPDLSGVTDMSYMFWGCVAFNQSVSNFDTATVTNMTGMFNSCATFNQSVSNFNTSAVTNMKQMFYGCSSFNQSVSNFDTSDVTDMSYMFYNCTVFNQSVSNFDTSDVTDMNNMFYGCSSFNQSVSNFDTASVTNMNNMFYGCAVFNQSVSNFDTASVTNMGGMFWGCAAFNQSVSNFDTASVTNMSRMFNSCVAFNQSVSNFDTSYVTDMNTMFYGCSSFNQSVSNFDTSAVTNMELMFYNCTAFRQSLASFDMSSVSNVSLMCSGCDINEIGTTTNYDATLVAWAAADVPNSLSFHGGSSKYSDTGQTARSSLISDDLWTITDGGHI